MTLTKTLTKCIEEELRSEQNSDLNYIFLKRPILRPDLKNLNVAQFEAKGKENSKQCCMRR